MPKFRKKIVVDAEQFFPNKKPWPKGVEDNIHSISGSHIGWIIYKPEAGYTVFPGDWIITDAGGERHYCKADIFEATYEPVEE